jgi:adenylate cyclase
VQLGRTRIGIETGPVVLGDVGSGAKIDYTAHGDALEMPDRDAEYNPPLYRRFCDVHKERGDSSMEDQDKNYDPMLKRSA